MFSSSQLFPGHPDALTPVFTALGVPAPRKPTVTALVPDEAELRELGPSVDTVLRVESTDTESLLLALSFQSRPTPGISVGWAHWISYLHFKHRLPPLLLVVCRDRTTAAWAAGPFEHRVGSWTSATVSPRVLGPDDLPEAGADKEMATRQPLLAALTALVHSESDAGEAMLTALARGLTSGRDTATAQYLCEFVEVGLAGTPARGRWRGLLASSAYVPWETPSTVSAVRRPAARTLQAAS
ncbi:hypothetical protein QFZ63_003990 [Streptomyces sp. B3I7]|uniref:hypothetical protein n=1 Tax=Streptomyces sp. B3I7 TaxID=3042269 RepID=UPI0027824E83|nr:hypothetical protein [Streptomyces sp. B3I7]MDQ0812276.1 hypothetical protein [Streptomyces sp. B3I7]